MRALIPLCFLAALAHGQLQHGRVASDFYGNVVWFETGAPPICESLWPTERIMEFSSGGGTSVIAASPLPHLWGGVVAPHTNDNGDLRAYSFYIAGSTSGIGGTSPPSYTGVVRHVTDGWEIRRPGRVALSRDGRWAAFAAGPCRLMDLWTGAETVLPANASSVADDGTLLSSGTRSLGISKPGPEPRRVLPGGRGRAPRTAWPARSARRSRDGSPRRVRARRWP